jgi:integrase
VGRRGLKLPKYVHGYVDRHGKARHYFRQRGRKEVPLPGLPFSTEFMDAYQAALNHAPPVVIGVNRTKPGTVHEAIARYLSAAAFAALARSTQGMRRALLERFRAEHGEKRLSMMRPQDVGKLLGKLKPYAQRNMLKTLRGLTTFALAPEQRLIEKDPTDGVTLAKAKDTGGHKTWSEAHIAAYRQHHKLGTRPRLALELVYGTMQRRSDIVRLGRQHVQNGMISLRQQKTGTQVDIAILPDLQTAIDAMSNCEHLTFLITELGKPFTAAGFGGWFREQCDVAGVSLSAHGLRKAGATRLAEHSCTDHEIMAWGGWKSIREVQRYTEAANRKRLALQGAQKLKAGTKVANLEARLAKKGRKS